MQDLKYYQVQWLITILKDYKNNLKEAKPLDENRLAQVYSLLDYFESYLLSL